MRVARLELTGIGPFEGAVFEIPEPTQGTGELVLFEGPNGSGKTTIAEAISGFAASDEFVQRLRDEAAEALSPPIGQLAKRFRDEGEALVRIEHGDYWRTYGFKPGRQGPWNGTPGPAFPPSPRRPWAAFAYKSHQPTPVIATRGPAEIETPPLRGALSFGTMEPASAHFGQLLVNLDQEVAKAFREAHREGASQDRRQELEQRATSRQKMLDEIARALSQALARKVTFEVPVGQHAPIVSIDGEPIPLDLLGEGMRSTLAWLSDLLVRLHRVPWEDAQRSPLEQDFWLILDEIDESLHPNMQVRLYPALRQLFPNARIYATTHSPFVVASVGEGVVFPIRPDKDHKVRGRVETRVLTPGQSLEWVTTEIFQAGTGFVDQQTRDMLDEHKRDIRRFRRTGTMDWDAFFTRRSKLFELNDEVRVAVAMQEVPVRREVDDQMLARAEAREQRDLGARA
jgi:energy-coupling factor transporter ATP-binding protein EcfA2